MIGDGKTYKRFRHSFPIPGEDLNEEVVVPTPEEWVELQKIYGGIVKGLSKN
jgi:hypothetical protein